MKFVELKDSQIYPAQNGAAKEIGDIVLSNSAIRGFTRAKTDETRTMITLRNGNILVTATSYDDIKSRLITEDGQNDKLY